MRPILLPALLCLAFLPAPAAAGESYDNCAGTISTLPVTLTTQGVWCLKGDLATGIASGAAITIEANNVTIDCNGFKIGGLNAGTGTQAVGVYSHSRLNATVRNCNIRGFYYGIGFAGGGGHVVEDSRFDANRVIGIYNNSDGVTIRGNQIVDTGGSTVAGTAYGILADGFSHIIDNTVFGVVASGSSDAFGIRSNSPGSVTGNRVSGVTSATGSDYGIRVSGNYGLVRDNYIYGDVGMTHGGIYCSNSSTTARDNVIAETVTGVINCMSVDNTVQL